jgi:hypothetical protein
VNYPSGEPNNFDRVAGDGTHSVFAADLHGLGGEVYFATVRSSPCHPDFTVGQTFVGAGKEIIRIAPGGLTFDRPWVTLPLQTGDTINGLFQDRFCSWDGDLIVTSRSGNVWRVTGTGAVTFVGATPAGAGILEGPTTVPVDSAKYGPWSGTILAADENLAAIWSIDEAGNFTAYRLVTQAESIRVIEPNQNFFGVNYGGSSLMGASAAQFTGIVGDILVAGETGLLVHIHWNGTTFETEEVAPAVSQWEGTTFAPAGIAPIPGIGKHLTYVGSMEGALKILPGSWVNGGLHLKLSQKNASAVTGTVTGSILVPVHCGGPHGPLASTSPITIPFTVPFTIPMNSTDWVPTPDQNSIDAWANAVQAGALCGANTPMYNSEGATLDAIVSSTSHTGVINLQWHYRVPAAKNKPNTNCTNANDPNRDRADVCGASWSATKEP